MRDRHCGACGRQNIREMQGFQFTVGRPWIVLALID